jgi:hypothetical protein
MGVKSRWCRDKSKLAVFNLNWIFDGEMSMDGLKAGQIKVVPSDSNPDNVTAVYKKKSENLVQVEIPKRQLQTLVMTEAEPLVAQPDGDKGLTCTQGVGIAALVVAGLSSAAGTATGAAVTFFNSSFAASTLSALGTTTFATNPATLVLGTVGVLMVTLGGRSTEPSYQGVA